MIKIKYSIRPFVKPNNQVAIRARWNSNSYEVTFITGVYAEMSKWDPDSHKAKRGTVHTVRSMTFSSSEINETISDFKQVIEETFQKCSIKNSIPTPTEFRVMVNDRLGRINEVTEDFVQPKKLTMKQMFDKFVKECGREKNWNKQPIYKYQQAFNHLRSANPKIRPDKITIEEMYSLRDWYVTNNYNNRTITKQISRLKVILRWINTQDGYTIPQEVLDFKPNLKMTAKIVKSLTYDELLHFAHFTFEDDQTGRLAKARDAWCFMAFTSLRVSDLRRLKTAHVNNGVINMFAQKTDEPLHIPVTEEAQFILDRYIDNSDLNSNVFDIPSTQKLNDAVKDAARAAKIDRVVTDIKYIGTKRIEESNKFCDVISNHDARRTFVSCSLAMGITPEAVMKCTGHRSYNTLKSYIETATETQDLQMEKWNKNQYRSKIINLLDDADESFLKEVLTDIQNKIAKAEH